MIVDKLNLFEFNKLSNQDKDTYIIYLLSRPEDTRTNIDKHILRFYSLQINSSNHYILFEE
jgi:hypothetical protein